MAVWSPVITEAVIAVAVLPGAIALTRMPCGASSLATDLVRPITPCLAAVYTCGPSPPSTPAVLDVEMIEPAPDPWATIARPACFIPRNTLESRMAIVSFHAS